MCVGLELAAAQQVAGALYLSPLSLAGQDKGTGQVPRSKPRAGSKPRGLFLAQAKSAPRQGYSPHRRVSRQMDTGSAKADGVSRGVLPGETTSRPLSLLPVTQHKHNTQRVSCQLWMVPLSSVVSEVSILSSPKGVYRRVRAAENPPSIRAPRYSG